MKYELYKFVSGDFACHVNDDVKVAVRQCNRCGKRQAHTLPKSNGGYLNWQDWKFKEGQTLMLNEI